MIDLLNKCVRVTPDRECSPQDYRIQAKMGRDQADDFLSPNKLSDAEAVTILQFMNVQLPPIWPDGNGWLICMDILHLENIIRPAIRIAPVAEPEEIEAERKNPHVFGSKEYDAWDHAQKVIDVQRENPAFRAGAAAQHFVASSKRIRAELGYMEVVQLDEAIRRTIAWERQNPPSTINLKQFDYQAEDAALAATA